MLNYLNIPIVILSKDRIKYLDLELKSISSTIPSNTSVYILNDGTKDKNMLDYLSTCNKISVDNRWRLPIGDSNWPIGHINNLAGDRSSCNIVNGIGGKTNVIFCRDSAGTKNLGMAVKFVFDNTNADYVIKMEDDLVFDKDWYYNLIRTIKNSNGFDLVSGFRYFYGRVNINAENKVLDDMQEGYTGGQLMIASRRYYEKCPKVFINEIQTIWDNDDFWINECRKNNLKFGVVKNSVCQHFGIITESNQKQCIKDGVYIKADSNFKGEVVFSDSVISFGNHNKNFVL